MKHLNQPVEGIFSNYWYRKKLAEIAIHAMNGILSSGKYDLEDVPGIARVIAAGMMDNLYGPDPSAQEEKPFNMGDIGRP